MTELLYQIDSYVKEFEARIVKVDGPNIVLDKTVFNPRAGGLDHDTGYIEGPSGKFRVVEVLLNRETGEVIHRLDVEDHGLQSGDVIEGVIDWGRRYKLMRLHTAAHIISAIMYRDYGTLITGGHISPDKAYDDYSIERFDPQIFVDAINKANDIVKRGLDVVIKWMKREEALRIPGMVKLASRAPPNVEVLRIVEIPGVDIQADGGPHVRNTREIGEIVMLKAVNKGRKRKRLYYTVKP